MMHDEAAKSWNEVTAFCTDLRRTVSDVIDRAPKIAAIFGAGTQGRFALRYLKERGVSVHCFADNDVNKHGTRLNDVPVVPPHDPLFASAPIVVVATRYAGHSVRQQLDDLKMCSVSFDALFVLTNIERISNVRNQLLTDHRSRLVYDAILKTMLTGRNAYCASVMEDNQYFALPDFSNSESEYFVDAGAYVGDTTEKFIWTHGGVFMKIYAFEPGKRQMEAMKVRVERLEREWAISTSSIVCENAGLADTTCVLPMNTPDVLANTHFNDHASEVDTFNAEPAVNTGHVRCYSLDSYLAGRPTTFIKADIEGMELAMLHGARDTIRTFRPKLALSIYHHPAHVVEIAEYIHCLIPDYCMAVRQHSAVFAESVLYCWIPRDIPGDCV